MNKFILYSLAFLSSWPLVFIIALFVYLKLQDPISWLIRDSVFFSSMVKAMTIAMVLFTILDLIGLFIFSVFHIFKLKELSKKQKNIFLFILFFGNVFILPVFWFILFTNKNLQGSYKVS